MKKLMSDLKKETDYIVLLDTNIVINLEHKQCSNIDLVAIRKIFGQDAKPFISDLSFCEMIIGSKRLEDFQNHCNELKEMEFLMCGNDEELTDFLSLTNMELIQSESEFINFKKETISLRNKVLFSIYEALITLYFKTNMLLLNNIDKNYWDMAFLSFNHLISVCGEEYHKILSDCFNSFIDDKKESKHLVKLPFVELIVALVTRSNPEKYIESDVRNKLEVIMTPKNYSNLIKSWQVDKNNNDNFWLEKSYINKSRKLVEYDPDSEIIVDGICYLVSKMIFNGANFNFHDLIDLYNIHLSSKNEVTTYYYTNDIRGWKEFCQIEKELTTDINIKFNE